MYPAADWQSAWRWQPCTADFIVWLSAIWLRLCCVVGQAVPPAIDNSAAVETRENIDMEVLRVELTVRLHGSGERPLPNALAGEN